MLLYIINTINRFALFLSHIFNQTKLVWFSKMKFRLTNCSIFVLVKL